MITIVTGGARSGKSVFAESRFKKDEELVYIATSRVYDGEMEDRVKKHRERRPSNWTTFEGYIDLDRAVDGSPNYLLDCLTNMASNIMFDITKDLERISPEVQKQVEDRVVMECFKLIAAVREAGANLVIVTNEVGSSIVPADHVSRVFRDVQGNVNQRVARICDEAYLIALGYPVRLK